MAMVIDMRIVAAAMMTGATIRADVPTFEILPLPPQLRKVDEVQGVSDDGSTVVGTGNDALNSNGRLAYRWTPDQGTVLLPLLPGYVWADAWRVSGDGQTVAGTCFGLDYSASVPCIWDAENAPHALPLLPGHDYGFLYGIARRAPVVVGYSGRQDTRQIVAVRWRAHHAESLGVPPGWTHSAAIDVSANGQVVVGSLSDLPAGRSGAFRWTPQRRMEVLPTLTSPGRATAERVSDDGRVIVGGGLSVAGYEHAMRWRGDAPPEDLGVPAGYRYSYAYAISGDGRTIAGDYRIPGGPRAFVYTDRAGMVDLERFLVKRGVDLHGFTLITCFDLTTDGSILVGHGYNPTTRADMAFRVEVPGGF